MSHSSQSPRRDNSADANGKSKIWIDRELKLQAARVPRESRIRWLAENSEAPIPESRLASLYEFVFEEPFSLRYFGAHASLVELVASTPGVFRDTSNGSAKGRAFLCADSSALCAPNTYVPPEWALTLSSEPGSLQVPTFHQENRFWLRVRKHGAFLRTHDLSAVLFRLSERQGISLDVDAKVARKGTRLRRRSFLRVGRTPDTDLVFRHPSVSRLHAVLQFAKDGLFLYDTSLHGTILNGRKVPTHQFVQLKDGDELQFGSSSRRCLLQVTEPRADGTREEVCREERMPLAEKDTNPHANPLDHLSKKMRKLSLDPSLVAQNHTSETHDSTGARLRRGCRRGLDFDRDAPRKAPNAWLHKDEKESESESSEGNEPSPRRVFVIAGIDFPASIHKLHKFTVAKLRLYLKENRIAVGKVKKAKLVDIIRHDIQTHFVH